LFLKTKYLIVNSRGSLITSYKLEGSNYGRLILTADPKHSSHENALKHILE